MNSPARWKKRFQNFERAYETFLRILDLYEKKSSENNELALIQTYEFTFELSWKLLKDYLEDQGFADVSSPKKVLRRAFEQEIIHDDETWLKALHLHNETVHTYDEKLRKKAIQFIKDQFFHLIRDLYYHLKDEL